MLFKNKPRKSFISHIALFLCLLTETLALPMETPLETPEYWANLLRSEIVNRSNNQQRIIDLLDLGASLALTNDEKNALRSLAGGNSRFLNRISISLLTPYVSRNVAQNDVVERQKKEEYLALIRSRVLNPEPSRSRSRTSTTTTTSTSSTSSSSSRRSSAQKRPASTTQTQPPLKAQKVDQLHTVYQALKAVIVKKDFNAFKALLNSILGKREFLRALLSYQDLGSNQRTLFHLAMLNNTNDIFEYLLRLLNSFDLYRVLLLPDTANLTAIDYAVLGQQEDNIHALIYHQGSLLFVLNSMHEMPISYMLRSYNKALLARILSATSKERATLLHLAIASQNTQITQQLIDFILTYNSLHWIFAYEDSFGATPLMLARRLGNAQIIALLENAEARRLATVPSEQASETPQIITIDDEEQTGSETSGASGESSPEFLGQTTPTTVISEDEQSETGSEYTGTATNTPVYTSFEELAQALLGTGELPNAPSHRTTLSPENLEFTQGQRSSLFPFWHE